MMQKIKRSPHVSFKTVLSSPKMFAAFGFGSGLSPIVPGTMGTVAAIPLYLGLMLLPWWAYGVVVVVTGLVGIHLCGFASQKLGVHDHSGIVWDEFVGFWITMFLVPFSWLNVLIGFILFRIFDMAKPWPISWVDKHVHGGFGIMIDDVIAGIAAWACLQLLLIYLL